MAVSFEATLARTVRTLRERFAALRALGPVPAAMAETPAGEPYPYRGEGGKKLPVFESHDLPKPRWIGGAVVTREGAHVAGRDIWLAGNRSAGRRLMLICRDANGFVPLLRREFGLSADCGTGDAINRWLWTVFELAERGVPGSLLSLVTPVFRCGPNGVVHASEEDIQWAKEHPDDSDFFSNLLRGDFGSERHWQVADLIETSVMTMDLVELAIGSGTTGEANAPETLGVEAIRAAVSDSMKFALAEAKTQRKPRGGSTCERLRDLHTNVDPDFAETAPERLLGERIDRSPGTFPDSHYWRTVLQPAREKARLERKRVRGAKRWGHFDSVGRRDESPEDH